jgi:hypothetical protein
MLNKRIILVIGIIVIVGAAAFIAGRLLNAGIGPVGLGGPDGPVTIDREDIIPAPELPETTPEITGMFIERQDNTVMVQLVSFDAGVGDMLEDSPMQEDTGPRVEIVVTGETTVYRETTEFGHPVPGEDFSIQQTVEEATLDYMEAQTMITVWGRRNGDRVIAEVLLYMNPLMIKKQ